MDNAGACSQSVKTITLYTRVLLVIAFANASENGTGKFILPQNIVVHQQLKVT